MIPICLDQVEELQSALENNVMSDVVSMPMEHMEISSLDSDGVENEMLGDCEAAQSELLDECHSGSGPEPELLDRHEDQMLDGREDPMLSGKDGPMLSGGPVMDGRDGMLDGRDNELLECEDGVEGQMLGDCDRGEWYFSFFSL